MKIKFLFSFGLETLFYLSLICFVFKTCNPLRKGLSFFIRIFCNSTPNFFLLNIKKKIKNYITSMLSKAFWVFVFKTYAYNPLNKQCDLMDGTVWEFSVEWFW